MGAKEPCGDGCCTALGFLGFEDVSDFDDQVIEERGFEGGDDFDVFFAHVFEFVVGVDHIDIV